MNRGDLLHFAAGLHVAVGIVMIIELIDLREQRDLDAWIAKGRPGLQPLTSDVVDEEVSA